MTRPTFEELIGFEEAARVRAMNTALSAIFGETAPQRCRHCGIMDALDGHGLCQDCQDDIRDSERLPETEYPSRDDAFGLDGPNRE